MGVVHFAVLGLHAGVEGGVVGEGGLLVGQLELELEALGNALEAPRPATRDPSTADPPVDVSMTTQLGRRATSDEEGACGLRYAQAHAHSRTRRPR